jgi:hypothetical protein
MDKYGVKTNDDKDPMSKEATDKAICPLCGAKLEGKANVPKCPRHGTAPFEEDPEETIPDVG